jgi:hypothetical protein
MWAGHGASPWFGCQTQVGAVDLAHACATCCSAQLERVDLCGLDENVCGSSLDANAYAVDACVVFVRALVPWRRTELSCVLPLEDFPVGNYSLSVVVDGLASGPPVDRCTNASCNGSSPVRVGAVAGLHDQCVNVRICNHAVTPLLRLVALSRQVRLSCPVDHYGIDGQYCAGCPLGGRCDGDSVPYPLYGAFPMRPTLATPCMHPQLNYHRHVCCVFCKSMPC